MTNTSTVKNRLLALITCCLLLSSSGFSMIYTNCSSNLNGIILCGEISDLDRAPRLQAGTLCELSSEVKIEVTDDFSNLSACYQGYILRNWMASDACGDTVYCTQRLTVHYFSTLECFNNPVTLTCIEELTPQTASGGMFLTQSCIPQSSLQFEPVDDFSNLSECGEGEVIRTWNITHPCGLLRTCTRKIIIEHSDEPLITCDPFDEIHECNGQDGNNFAALAWNNANISTLANCSANECGNLSVTSDFDPNNFSATCAEVETLTVTYTITEECGDVVNKTATFTIEGEMPPNPLCADINIQSTDNQLVITGIVAPNAIVKVFDHNWQIISNCSGECPETLTIPNLSAGEIFHTDIQLYDEGWNYICEDKQDIEIFGGGEPCDTSICQGDVILQTQAEVDAFCGCEVIEGDLYIGVSSNTEIQLEESDIMDLGVLESLQRVTGVFSIVRTSLTNLDGLQNLKKVYTLGVIQNTQLNSLAGLNNLLEVEETLAIIRNDKLENIDGLANLSRLGNQLNIQDNKSLKSISSVSKLKKVGAINLIGNTELTSLNGLENLDSVRSKTGISSSYLDILNNESLVDISAVANLTFIGGNLSISRNSLLQNCCPILHLIDEDPSNGVILGRVGLSNNAPDFCDSEVQILSNCSTPIVDCENVQIITENNQIIIEGLTASNEIVKVFDKDYTILFECNGNCESTELTGTFPAGTYIVDLQLYDAHWDLICAEQRSIMLANETPCNLPDCETIPPVLTNLPPDLTFNANDGFDTTFPIPVDNCDPDPQLAVEDVVNAEETEIVRTFTAIDNCGNTATAKQIITIIRDEITDCADLVISVTNNAIILDNLNAPNSIIKLFDDNYQIIFECIAECENSISVPVGAEGVYHTDIQLYDENWQFICADKQDVLIEAITPSCYNVLELTVRSEKDAMVWNGNSYDDYENRNYGEDDRLLVHAWTNSSIPDVSRSLVDFDLGQLPTNATILSATITLYNDRNSSSFDGQHSGDNIGFIQRITTDWEEETVTWNNQPEYSIRKEVPVPKLTDNQHLMELDVTGLLQDAKSDEQSSLGLMVRLVAEVQYRALVFASSDHPYINLHPKLDIKFNVPATSVCQGDIILRTQADVDAFCGCEVVEGDLEIGDNFTVQNDITSIANLSGIKRLTGELRINNTQLVNLEGLASINSLGGLVIWNNEFLEEIEALQNLTSNTGILAIRNSPKLTDISSLKKLEKITYLILEEIAVADLTFLRNIPKETMNTIYIRRLNRLKSLEGLNNVRYVVKNGIYAGDLSIASNDSLENIEVLQHILEVENDFSVSGNERLETCCSIAHLIDDDLSNGKVGASIVVQNNAVFCKTIEKILDHCPSEANCNEVNISNNQLDLIISNLTAPIQILKVFDNNFATIYECFADCEETVNLTDLAAGRYHVNINFYDEDWQPICEKTETIIIEANSQSRNINLLSADFALYPNPAETATYIDLSQLKGEKVQLALFNQFGQKVSHQVFEKLTIQKAKIDLASIQNGLYLLHLKVDGKKDVVKKLIINRLY